MDKKKGNVLQRTFRISNQGRGTYILSCASSVLGILSGIVPYLSVYFITRQLLMPSADTDTRHVVIQWVAVAGISILCDMIFSYLGSLGCHFTAFRLLYGFRLKVMERIGKLPMGFFSTTTSGGIQKTMDENIEKIEGFVAHMFPDIIGSLLIVLTLIVSIFALNLWLALAVLAAIVGGAAFQRLVFGGKNAKQLWVDVAAASQRVTGAFSEYVKGMAEVKLFGLTGSMTKGLEDNIESYKSWELKSYKRSSLPMSAYKTLVMSALTIVLPVAILLIAANPSPETFLAVLMALILTPAIYDPLMTCLNYGTQMAMLGVGLDDIDRIMDQKEIPEPREAKTLTGWDLEFCDVSFSYQDVSDPMRRMALSHVSFLAPQGKMTALVGPSGSGKSTVGQLISRFWDVESGAITIGGTDIRELSTEYLMNNISTVFQDTYLFADTVRANITMNRDYSDEAVKKAAIAARCHDFIMALPDGYNTRIGTGGADLSGGETQRISIARAILKNSNIVVLDEALAYSDAENENLIQKAIANLIQDKTVIIIAHRLQSIQRADQILVLSDSRIIEHGRHDELMANDTEYKQLWEIQHEADAWAIDLTAEKEAVR